jgi:hypothetical protein
VGAEGGEEAGGRELIGKTIIEEAGRETKK